MLKDKLKGINSGRLKSIIIILLLAGVAAYAATRFIEQKANAGHIKVSGNIEGDDVRIAFRVNGQILELLADEGYVIKKDDVVARLKTDELEKINANNKAALKAAEWNYELAKVDYERSAKLYEAGAISAQKRDADKTAFEAAKANVDQLRAELELSETRLGFAELASPLNGYILVKSSLAGEVIEPGTPVFTAVDLNNIWVTAYLSERDLGKVKLNQKAYVVTDTYPGKKYNGWVSFISDEAEFTPKFIQTTEERVKLVYRIKVRADNSSLELKPGMPADAYIAVE